MSANNKESNLLIACTGSVATIKLRELILDLQKNAQQHGKILNIKVMLTEKAKYFLKQEDYIPDVVYHTDEDEWSMWKTRGDPVLHIELAKWASVCLIAPLDANTLAKISQGICDNLVTCTIRAWDMRTPLIFCPAMNTKMWDHPITAQQINTLHSWGFIQVPCISKTLMCGDVGIGAMAEIDTITRAVFTHLR